jgi:hypothetical protein
MVIMSSQAFPIRKTELEQQVQELWWVLERYDGPWSFPSPFTGCTTPGHPYKLGARDGLPPYDTTRAYFAELKRLYVESRAKTKAAREREDESKEEKDEECGDL